MDGTIAPLTPAQVQSPAPAPALRFHLFDGIAAASRIADAWDRLVEARAEQADIYDSYAWLASWSAALPRESSRLHIFTVLDSADEPAVILPLIPNRLGGWAGAGPPYRFRFRPIARTVDGGSTILDEAMSILTDGLAREGVASISIEDLPPADPAVRAFISALERSGYRIETRETEDECHSPTTGGWEAYRSLFRKYERNVNNAVNRARLLGTIRLYENHDSPDAFDSWKDIHDRSWKGPMREPWISMRQEFWNRARDRGWLRFDRMSISGVDVACLVSFRIGGVVTLYSETYDERLAAASPGSILIWDAIRRSVIEFDPKVVDFLPGRGPQKNILGTDRPRLIRLDAIRPRPLHRITVPVRRNVQRTAGAASARLRGILRKRRQIAVSTPARMRNVRVKPGPLRPGARAYPLKQLDRRTEMFLVVSGGHTGIDRMSAQWSDGDQWWVISRDGHPLSACLRVGIGEASLGNVRPVREIVFAPEEDLSVEEVLQIAAVGAGVSLEASVPDPAGELRGAPIPVHRAPIPWTWKHGPIG
jgi:hypothetical protein